MRALDRFLYADVTAHDRQGEPDQRERRIIISAYRRNGAAEAIAALIEAGYPGRSITWLRTWCCNNKIRAPRSGRAWRLPDRPGNPTVSSLKSQISNFKCILLLSCSPALLSPAPARAADLSKLFAAICQVETGGHADPANASGDGGRSLGPYQIQRGYHQDAWSSGLKSQISNLKSYAQVRNRAYAERTMVRYWQRYCPRALARGDFETLARVHNGGPAGHRNPKTRAYWLKVKRNMGGM